MKVSLSLSKEELDQAIYCYLRARGILTANTTLSSILVMPGNVDLPIRVEYTPTGRLPAPERLIEEQKTAWDRLKDDE